jgi:hypothetical protein
MGDGEPGSRRGSSDADRGGRGGRIEVDSTSWRTDDGWRLLVLGAAAVLLVGLLLDLWTRRYRPAGDLGHIFFGVGATVIVLGAATLLVGPVVRRGVGPAPSRFLQVVLPVAALSVIAPVMVVAVSATGRTGSANAGSGSATTAAHDHGAATSGTGGGTPSGTDPATAGAALAEEITGNTVPAALHDHGHGSTVYPDQPMDGATRDLLAKQLETARTIALRYPTVADATRAGYIMVTPFVPLIGAHYLNLRYVDGTFDPARPEMLLYDGTRADSKIVGLSYFVSSRRGQPDGFAGPNDHWHQHIGLCIKGTVVVGGESITPEECTRRGGNKVALSDMWMVHVWEVPGWESPQGVFSPEQEDLLQASD